MKGLNKIKKDLDILKNNISKNSKFIEYTYKGETLFYRNKNYILLPLVWRIHDESSCGFDYTIYTLEKFGLIKTERIELTPSIAIDFINELPNLYTYYRNRMQNLIKVSKTDIQMMEIILLLYRIAEVPSEFVFNQHLKIFQNKNVLSFVSNSKLLVLENNVKYHKEISDYTIQFEDVLFYEAYNLYCVYLGNYKYKRNSKW